MYDAAVYVTLALMLVSGADYVRLAWNKRTSPVTATWILLMVVMSMSFWTYWSNPKKSWTGNIGVVSCLINVAIILVGVVASHLKHGTLKVSFDRVQKGALVAGASVMVFWFFTRNPFWAYVLVQVIGLIAYLPTIKRLWNAKKCTEPAFLWIAVCLGGLTSMYPAWIRHDIFSWIFLVRVVPSTGLMALLILRVQSRTKVEEFIGLPIQTLKAD